MHARVCTRVCAYEYVGVSACKCLCVCAHILWTSYFCLHVGVRVSLCVHICI